MRVFTFCKWQYGFWFRLFGYGLHVTKAKHHMPLFSERFGFRKPLYFLGYRIEGLRP